MKLPEKYPLVRVIYPRPPGQYGPGHSFDSRNAHVLTSADLRKLMKYAHTQGILGVPLNLDKL